MQLKNNSICDTKEYTDIARKVRCDILKIVYNAKAPHIGSSFSIVEILVALYFKSLNISPDNIKDENRDRFILSKGHGCPALYAVLKERGILKKEVLNGFGLDGGTLEEHPTRDLAKGIEVSTGSLGHGLAIGSGMAIAAKYEKRPYRIFVLMSDGEIQSGFVWEAAMFAAHHKLDNLVAIIDCNKIQALGNVKEINNIEPLADKWRSFGWGILEVDGHNFTQLLSAFDTIPFEKGKPSVVIADTIKGKGVSFMENNLLWHYRSPDETEYQNAMKELG